MKKKTSLILIILSSLMLVSSQSIAKNTNQESSSPRIIDFAEQQWIIESYMSDKSYPGPNYYSNDEAHVWVDNKGFLNMTIQQNEFGQWVCSSVKSVLPAKYGIHRFKVIGNLEDLDKNTVIGMFFYRIDPYSPDQRAEVDIELSSWGFPKDTPDGTINASSNVHYVLWEPWSNDTTPVVQSSESFWMDMPRGTHSTHELTWHPKTLSFLSYFGHSPNNPNKKVARYFELSNNKADTWVLPKEDEKMHLLLNFWLHESDHPASMQSQSIKIKYEFEPYQEP
jgi:hypothetical protein